MTKTDRQSGTHLVLMPGLDGTGIMFGPLLRALSPHHSVTVITYPDDPDRSLTDHARFALGRLPADDVVIVAESFSGLVALMLLHERPPQVKGVVFSATFAEPLYRRMIRALSVVPGMSSFIKRLPARFLDILLFRSGADDSLVDLLRRALAEIGPRGLKRRARLIAEGYPHLDERFDIPALYLQPTRDRVVPASAAQWFAAHFSSLDLISFDAPHCLLQTNPSETAEIITSFAQRLI